jgi:5-methylcytosine-specific restriction endonuclease McrA
MGGQPNRLADGSLHLTDVSLVGPHLTDANHAEVIDAAKHKSKREVEQLIVRLRPQPDVPAVVRKLPATRPAPSLTQKGTPQTYALAQEQRSQICAPTQAAITAAPHPPVEIKPLAPERFKVQFTVSRKTHDKLRYVQNLLRHTIPDGDPAQIFDRALTRLLAHLSKTKFAATDQPRRGHAATHTRHIAAAVRREVWRRDERRCAFRGERGRCTETGYLEFHHVVPYAKGGPTSARNLELRCRAHNAYEAEQQFGRREPSFWAREPVAAYGVNRTTRSGPSSMCSTPVVVRFQT